MKLKKRNLLTVILSVLCAVLLAVGISFVLPKNEVKTAHAAVNQPQIDFGAVGYFVDGAPGSTFADVAYSSLSFGSATGITNYTTTTGTTGSIGVTLTKVDGIVHRAAVTPVIIKVKIPAYTVYTVKYTATLNNATGAHGKDNAFCNNWQDATNGYNITVPLNALTNNHQLPDYSGYRESTFYGDLNGKFVFYNDSNAEKEMSVYSIHIAKISDGCGSPCSASFNFSITPQIEEVTKIAAPTTTDTTPETYDGTTKTFNFTYDTPTVNKPDAKQNYTTANYTTAHENIDTTIEAVDYDGNVIATGYNLSKVDENGTLTATEAGKYKVKFNLKAGAKTAGIEWTGGGTGEKSITFEIERAKLTVPKVQGSPQTYDPNGCEFGVDTNYDSTKMTASGVTSGVTWNVATSEFEATDAKTYTVKFVLNDKKNYEWNVSSNKTADQTATVKIEPKKLAVPEITAPQEYTGNALQFVLTNFNAGTDIKVDSATGTGSNTVTGANGAAITDTTDTFEATKVGKYTVTLSLRDTTNFTWDDNSTTAKAIQFEITQKELLAAAPSSSETNNIGNAEWEYGNDTVTITISDGRANGENLNLLFYYDNKSNQLTGTTTGNVTVIKMPSDIAVGTHTFTVELNGTTGDNANYKVTKNNTLSFKITSGKIDPGTYGWIYTKDSAAGGSIADGDKLPFELKPNNAIDGVKYEVSIQIPDSDKDKVAIDTNKYVNGYKTRSGDKVGTVKTIVAFKSINPDFQFEVNGNKQNTIEVELNWEIEKGTFDLSGVKWEYSLDGSAWADYDATNPPQYNDGNYITVRVKATTFPSGLSLDSLYTGSEEYDVDNSYVAKVSISDLKYNTSNFNAPDTSLLDLNWEITKKNLFTSFKNVKESYSNANGSGSFILKQLSVPAGFEGYITYKYYDQNGAPVTLDDIKDLADPTTVRKYKIEAYIDPAYAANYEVDDNGSTPSDNFETGSKNKLANVTIDGNDGSTPIKADYDGKNHFDTSVIKVTGDDAMNVTDFTVTYYKGKSPVAGNELSAGELPKDVGEYCIEVILGATAAKKYILATDWFVVEVQPMAIDLPDIGNIIFTGGSINLVDYMTGFDSSIMEFVAGGDFEDIRNVGKTAYSATITLKNAN
ncbi:MAG: hypothetical protein K2O41_02175, partial [Clostridia bacterium]|nr:hypothetical protein [Clostridia bacterium]